MLLEKSNEEDEHPSLSQHKAVQYCACVETKY